MFRIAESRSHRLRAIDAVARDARLSVRRTWVTADNVAISLVLRGDVRAVCTVHAHFGADGVMTARIQRSCDTWTSVRTGRRERDETEIHRLASAFEPAFHRFIETLRREAESGIPPRMRVPPYPGAAMPAFAAFACDAPRVAHAGH